MSPHSKSCALSAFLFLLSGTATAGYEIPRCVVAQGGGETAGENHIAIGTIGQPTIGATADLSRSMQIGFWYASFGIPDAVDESDAGIPLEFSLGPAFPNPGGRLTTLRVAIPDRSFVVVKIYDIRGREVHCLLSGEVEPGYHWIVLEPADLSSGVYFCKMITRDFQQTRRLVLVR